MNWPDVHCQYWLIMISLTNIIPTRKLQVIYTFETHSEEGNVLYGIDVFIKPDFRGLRLGRRLYDYRKELCERINLRGSAFGGRIP